MIPKRRRLKSAHILPLIALLAIGAALLPAQTLAQSCYGGYCGSGDGADGDAKVEVTVTITVSPADAGSVLVNGTEPKSGVFTAWQGDSLVLEAIPNDGYIFDGWTDWFSESASSVEAPIYNHKTLTAHFVEDSEEPADVEIEDSEWLPKGTVALDKRGNTLADVSVELRLPRALPSNGVLVGDVYDFKPDGATFAPPIPLSLPYEVGSLPAGTDENALAIATFDSTLQDWVLLPSEVNVQDAVVITRVAHFSQFAIVAPMPTLAGSVPLVTPGFSFSSLSVAPGTAYQGQDITVNIVASYEGANSQARTSVFVTLDGEVADETEIVLSPGDNVFVKFTVQPPKEGTYTIEVNGLRENVSVTGEAMPQALTQAIALTNQDGFRPLEIGSPSLWSNWRYGAYAGGALVLLLIVAPLLRAVKRRILRYRYDL